MNPSSASLQGIQPDSLADIKPLHDPKISVADLTLIVAIILFVTLFAYWLWRRWRRSQSAGSSFELQDNPPVPWDHEVEQVFLRLRNLPNDAEIFRSSYFELSAVVRRLLEVKTGVGATEMTAFEISRLVAPRFDAETYEAIVSFFARSEKVQFAKNDPQLTWHSDLAWSFEFFKKIRMDLQMQENEKNCNESAPQLGGKSHS